VDHLELVLFGILVAIAALTFVARAIDVPYPIALVIGGSFLGFVPGVPDVELDPDIVLLIFLPPLLFNAAYFTSLRDLRQNTRPIVMTAVGLVLLTMGAVAVVAHEAIDGVPWAVAFALGAIVAPTDPLAGTAIARRLGVPRGLLAVIEGESLVNDGTALVAYRTAVAAAIGGTFDALSAGIDFVASVVGGIAVGLVAGWILVQILRRVIGDPVLGVTISLICGYAAYLPAEELGVSGVLAAVAVGLYLGRRSPQISTAQGRLQAYAFWEVLVFILNAVLFVLVGLQLPAIIDHQDRSIAELVGLGLLVSSVVVGCRLLWTNTAPYLVRAIDRRPSQVARRVSWRVRMIAAWCGMRGAVSLAAALALPLETDAGAPLPDRDLVIFLAYSVILVTLVFQGLTLPLLIRAMRVEDDGGGEYEELIARKTATQAAKERLDLLAAEEWTRNDTVERMRGLYDFRYRRLRQRALTFRGDGLDDGDEDLEARSLDYQRTVREVIAAQRDAVVRLRDEGEISDEVMHRLERELDLEEERLEI
jgi:CPA1 family monovalent cation:H+ antiporter